MGSRLSSANLIPTFVAADATRALHAQSTARQRVIMGNCPVFGGIDKNLQLAAYAPPPATGAGVPRKRHHQHGGGGRGVQAVRAASSTRARELAKMGKKAAAYGYGEPLLKKKHLDFYYADATITTTTTTKDEPRATGGGAAPSSPRFRMTPEERSAEAQRILATARAGAAAAAGGTEEQREPESERQAASR